MQSGSLNGEFEVLMHEYTQIVFCFFSGALYGQNKLLVSFKCPTL